MREAKAPDKQKTSDKDLDELKRGGERDAHEGKLDRKRVDEFHLVTSSMFKCLDEEYEDRMPSLSEDLTAAHYRAIEALFMARTACDVSFGEKLSGLERAGLLNQALIQLQPILSLALRPDFPDRKQALATYRALGAEIQKLQAAIAFAILVEEGKGKKDKKKVVKKEEDDDLPANTSGSAGEDAGSSDIENDPRHAVTPPVKKQKQPPGAPGQPDDDVETPSRFDAPFKSTV